MNRSMIAKLSLGAVVTCALTLSTALAGTISRVPSSTNGFSIQNGGPTSGPQLSLSGDGIFTTQPTFSVPAGSGLTPVSGGPGQVTTQPVTPSIVVAPVPDSGSTVILFAVSFLGLVVVRSKLRRT
jgi:hypothetical protein